MILGEQFNKQWDSKVKFSLSSFDRVIFTGYLPFYSDLALNRWVGGQLKIRHKDFLDQLEKMSDQLVASAKQLATQAGAPYHYLQGRCRKESLVNEVALERREPDGLITVLCTQESCRTVKLVHGQNRPALKFEYRPQRVLYFYLNHREFGRMFVRVQTWFPWRIQVYVNGHDYVARQLLKRGIEFEQRDNAFLSIAEPQVAQRLADQFAGLHWESILNGFARQFNPLLTHSWLKDRHYSWVVDQAEISTDVLFTEQSVLSALYPRWLDHAVVNYRASDIMSFLGRRCTPHFDGEVLTSCQKQRWPGARIKHQVANNWLKMYDKFGRVLRVETVINCPKGFKTPDTVLTPAGRQVVWKRLGKAIKNFRRYYEIGCSANLRYLDALAPVQDHRSSYQQVGELVESQEKDGRRYAGFNVAKVTDIEFIAAVTAGEHHLRGFKTEDIRHRLHGECRDRHQRRRQAQAISRRLKRLHVRGLIAKIPRSHRWKTSAQGQRLLPKIISLYYHGLSNVA